MRVSIFLFAEIRFESNQFVLVCRAQVTIVGPAETGLNSMFGNAFAIGIVVFYVLLSRFWFFGGRIRVFISELHLCVFNRKCLNI